MLGLMMTAASGAGNVFAPLIRFTLVWKSVRWTHDWLALEILAFVSPHDLAE